MKKAFALALVLAVGQHASLNAAQASSRDLDDSSFRTDKALIATNSAAIGAAATGHAVFAKKEATDLLRKGAYAKKTGQFTLINHAKEARLMTGLARLSTGVAAAMAIEVLLILDDLALDGRVQDQFAAVHEKVIKPGYDLSFDDIRHATIGQRSSAGGAH